MTTVLGVQGDGWSAIGADSLVSDDDGRRYPLGPSTSKIVQRGHYYIAAAGEVRALNILAYVFNPPQPGARSGSKLDRFMISKFVPEMKNAFEDQGYAPSDTKVSAEQGSSVMVSVNGTLYHFGYDYSWIRNTAGVYYAGSGGDVAIGALTALHPEPFEKTEQQDAVEIIKFAIDVASMYDIGTESPSTVIVDNA